MCGQTVENNVRSKAELDHLLNWVTGYSHEELDTQVSVGKDCRSIIEQAPLCPYTERIKGVVCGVRLEKVEDMIMRELRYMDNFLDGLAPVKKSESILRTP